MRVLMVYANPNQAVPVSPYGLEILRGNLRARGDQAEVRIVNPFIEALDPASHLDSVLAAVAPDIVAFSVRNIDNSVVAMTPEPPPDGSPIDVVSYLPDIGRLVDRVRAWDPEVACVMGGAAFTSCPTECLSRFGLDFGLVGPAEETFRLLVAHLAEGPPPYLPRLTEIMPQLPGAVFRSPAAPGGFRITPQVASLDTEPPYTPAIAPEYQLLYRFRHIPVAVRTKSGCPLRCSYCIDPVNMRRTDLRPMSNVLDDIEHYVNRYGLSRFHIADAELNLPYEDRLVEFCAGLSERGLAERVRWHGYFNATPCSDRLLDALVSSGCLTPSFAIDSFQDQGLRGHQKSFRARQARDVLDRVLSKGAGRLAPQVCILLGQPGETLGSIRTNIRWMLHYADRGVHVAYSCGLRVYPNTPLARRPLAPEHLYARSGRTVSGSFLDPVVYCEPLPPRDLAAYLEDQIAGHPNVRVFAEWPWPEARYAEPLRLFNVGVHRMAYGRFGEAAELFGSALAQVPQFTPAQTARRLLDTQGLIASRASGPN